MFRVSFIVLALLFVNIGMAKAGDAAAGKVKFKKYCAACHGITGKGDGPAAAKLKPKPKDLGATTQSDATLSKVIKDGGGAAGLSDKMKGFGKVLSDADIANVVAYIRSLK